MAKITVLKGKAKKVNLKLVNEVKEHLKKSNGDLTIKFMQGKIEPCLNDGILSGGHFKLKSLLSVCGIEIE